jgi:pilus assembly protein CpaF
MFAIEYQIGKTEKKVSSCELDQCSVGKAPDNLIVLRGWSVGKKHATIYKRSSQIYIEDHGSMSGTEVNGKAVTGEYGPLTDSDMITIGDNSLRVFLGDTATVVSPTPADMVADVLPTASVSIPSVAAENKTATSPETQTAEEMLSKQVKLNDAKRFLHSKLIEQMDFRRLDVSGMSEDSLRDVAKATIEDVIKQANFSDPDIDLKNLARDLLNEVVGLGPLEELLADNDISEIMVNRFDEIYIEKKGRLTKAVITFSNDKAVLSAIERIVAPLGRRIDESSPMVDARLKDGSRVNAVIPPLALKGCNITIRKFSKNKLVDKDMINYGSVTTEMMQFLQIAVHHAANIIISGGTGSGKTTLLNVLSNYIPDDERIVTVEDAAELQLAKPHLISLESRPPNSEGKGSVSIRELVKNCLRMRPDRIVVGECRGGEALDMLQAMNTGHDGSMTTAHANTPRDCIARLEVMTLMSGLDLPIRAIREQISSAVHMIVQQSRFPDGSRKITHITEVVGMEGDIVQLQDIFLFKQDGYDENGKIRGKFIATGNIPDFCQDMAKRGLPVDLSIFRAENNQ